MIRGPGNVPANLAVVLGVWQHMAPCYSVAVDVVVVCIVCKWVAKEERQEGLYSSATVYQGDVRQ